MSIPPGKAFSKSRALILLDKEHRFEWTNGGDVQLGFQENGAHLNEPSADPSITSPRGWLVGPGSQLSDAILIRKVDPSCEPSTQLQCGF